VPRKTIKLRVLLAAAIAALAGALVILATLAVGETGVRRVRQEIGHSLAVLADQMQDKLDRNLYERFREIANSAALLGAQSRTRDDLYNRRDWLNTLQSTYPEYSWIGVVSTDGEVLSATQGTLEGVNVADKSWFAAGMKRPAIGDVREQQSAGVKPHNQARAKRFIDVSAPIYAANGELIGVIGANLSWSLAAEVRDSLFSGSETDRSVDVIVLSRDGKVLLGPLGVDGERFQMSDLRDADTAAERFAIENWPDGHEYVTGYAKSDGYRSFHGLGWTVLAREDADVALAPATRLQRDVILWGAGLTLLAIVAAWLMAGRMAAPMLLLANSAAKIRRGEATEIPEIGTYAEADTLAHSLRVLVSELQGRQRALAELNASLETQVAERTSRLAEQNVELEAAKTEAERATAAKSRFLAAASHDLRQPLHAMTLFARALSRRISGDEAQRLLGQLDQSLSSLREMFDALLNVSRLDAGLVAAHAAPVSLRQLVGDISAGLRVDAEYRGLRFKSHAVDAVVMSDAAILETIVRNLASNALKFTRTGGILLAARRRAGELSVEVYDTGPGIPADQHERIFREFERSKTQADGANDGLGLGLSIVRRYARLLGLRLDVRSRVGHGSCFALRFPAHAETTTEKPRIAVAARLTDLRGQRVLVLDDDELIVEALTRDLSDRGAEARGYTAGAEAERALAAGFAPHAAVVDYDLRSSESGPAIVRRLARRLGRPIPCLVLSGATDRQTMMALEMLGMPWMTKPARPDAIAAAVYDLCIGDRAAVSSSRPPEFQPGTGHP
jgi:signal transduction histidine kinase/ActR/RegA family two-component response regulator